MQHQTLYLTGASYWCRGFHHEHHQSWKVKYSSTEALISSDCTKFLNIYELSVFFHWFYLWFLRLCWIELFPNVLRMSGQFVSALWWFLSNSPTFICLYFIFVWLLFPRKLIIARAALWQKNSNFSPSLSLPQNLRLTILWSVSNLSLYSKLHDCSCFIYKYSLSRLPL